MNTFDQAIEPRTSAEEILAVLRGAGGAMRKEALKARCQRHADELQFNIAFGSLIDTRQVTRIQSEGLVLYRLAQPGDAEPKPPAGVATASGSRMAQYRARRAATQAAEAATLPDEDSARMPTRGSGRPPGQMRGRILEQLKIAPATGKAIGALVGCTGENAHFHLKKLVRLGLARQDAKTGYYIAIADGSASSAETATPDVPPADPAPAATQPTTLEPAAPLRLNELSRIGLFSDGELVLKDHDVQVVLSPQATQALVRFLDRALSRENAA